MNLPATSVLCSLSSDLWIQTWSGRAWPLCNPQASDVDWRDVAVSLGRLARFNGHTGSFYSVATHCLYVARLLEEAIGNPLIAARLLPRDDVAGLRAGLIVRALEAAGRCSETARRLVLAGLLHDAHEAVIGDISTPVARTLERLGGGDALRRLKLQQDMAIYAAAGLAWPLPEGWQLAIAAADAVMLATERRDLMAPAQRDWHAMPEPAPWRVRPEPEHRGADSFHARLMELL